VWSQPFRAATYLQRAQVSRYFSEVLIEPNFNFNDEPRLLTTAMIASAMPAAIIEIIYALGTNLVAKLQSLATALK